MRIRTLVGAVGGLVLAGTLTGAVMADDWIREEIIPIDGSWTLIGGQSVTFDFVPEPNPQFITGWSVEFDYDESPSDASWASDTRFVITSGSGVSSSVGGLDTPSDFDWSFDGPGSTNPGHYGDDPADIFLPWKDDPLPKDGIWSLTVTNDWAPDPNPNVISNIVLHLYKIPAPGALALLGVAGVLGGRRRRS